MTLSKILPQASAANNFEKSNHVGGPSGTRFTRFMLALINIESTNGHDSQSFKEIQNRENVL